MPLTITPASQSNVDALIVLVEHLADYEQLPRPDAGAKAGLRRDLLDPSANVEGYLALADSQPVAGAILYTTYSTFAGRPVLYLEDFVVREEHRRGGYGQQLFDYCLRLAQTRGCARLDWNVLKWNEPAIRFYEKNGATRVTEWDWYRLST